MVVITLNVQLFFSFSYILQVLIQPVTKPCIIEGQNYLFQMLERIDFEYKESKPEYLTSHTF